MGLHRDNGNDYSGFRVYGLGCGALVLVFSGSRGSACKVWGRERKPKQTIDPSGNIWTATQHAVKHKPFSG